MKQTSLVVGDILWPQVVIPTNRVMRNLMCAGPLIMECLLVDAVYCATPGCFTIVPPFDPLGSTLAVLHGFSGAQSSPRCGRLGSVLTQGVRARVGLCSDIGSRSVKDDKGWV